ncbi:FkbM family methyltransferase [Azospirillum sp. SYSU D00513]|uniref:FkbM family methyltransferase n=1 Tax=Azospirillum sp. SYSU D00513 TaxID=2812561 RepID=UPI001A962D42|nr:FkbM family methyltransferase [Azospirillum sp. SYSU D00513]
MSESGDAEFQLSSPGGTVRLMFLRHDWSGLVEISCAGEAQVIDLYADEQDINFAYEMAAPAGAVCTIRVLGKRSRQSSGHQVWLLGVMLDELPKELGRSRTLSETVRVISGDWGKFLVLKTDMDIPNAIEREGSWAPHDIEVFKTHIGAGDFVLDIGANFGHHSVVFSKIVGPNGLVVSVEAQRVMYQLLGANCVLNGCWNIRPIHMAASDKAGELTLFPISYTGDANFGSLGVNLHPERYNAENAAESVPAVTMDDYLSEHHPGRQVKFIKIDVQTFELFVLRGLARTIASHRPSLFFEVSPKWMHATGYDYRDIYSFFRDLKYSFKHFRELPFGSDGIPEIPFDDDIEWDVLALPEPV